MFLRVLVTGGAGFIGSHIVDLLVARGDQVCVIDSLDPHVHSETVEFPCDVRFVHGNIQSHALLNEALSGGVDLVFHEAAMVGFGKGADEAEAYFSTNVIGTIRLLEAIAKTCDTPPRFILGSTMALYGEGAYECEKCGFARGVNRRLEDLTRQRWEPLCSKCGAPLKPLPVTEDHPQTPNNIYSISKLNQELLCMLLGRHYQIPVVALRYHNVYGPRMPRDTPYAGVASIFKSRLLVGLSPIIFEDGAQLRDFVHVEDVARANLLAADAPLDSIAYEAFNVGTGRPHRIVEFARVLGEALGRNVKPEFPGLFRHGDVRHIFANTWKIEKLGFKPRVAFNEGVERFAHEPIRASPKMMVK